MKIKFYSYASIMTSREAAPEQICIIANPKASHPDKVEQFASTVQDAASGEVQLVQTGHPDEVDNVQLVADLAQDGMLFVVNGGDGTIHAVANGIKRSGKSDIAITATPCGNADDASTSWLGRDFCEDEENIRRLLQFGEPVPIPLIRVEHDGEVRHAISYWGMGMSGQSAVKMNHPDYRAAKEKRGDNMNRITDAGKVVPLLLPRERNIFSFASGGSTRQVRELLISSANRFAREFMVDVDPWGNEVVVNEFGPDGFVRGLVQRLATEQYRPALTGLLAEGSLTPRSLKSTLEGRRTSRGLMGLPFEGLTMELLQDTPVQFDGEPASMTRGTVVDISVEPDALLGLCPPSPG